MANTNPTIEGSQIRDRDTTKMCTNSRDNQNTGTTGLSQNNLEYHKYLCTSLPLSNKVSVGNEFYSSTSS